MKLLINTELASTLPMPQFYFTWGDEPRGTVSTGRYDENDVYRYCGLIDRQSIKGLGLQFNNPNN